jgi:hypothetical protein
MWDSRRIFCTNQASNYLPLAGTLPQDKERLLATLRSWRKGNRRCGLKEG